MVQYYRDMWAKHSEMCAPLSNLEKECGESKTTKKNKIKKTLKVGSNSSRSITKEIVLAYPDFSKTFEIYTDASTLQFTDGGSSWKNCL
jgi:hypothetical protein